MDQKVSVQQISIGQEAFCPPQLYQESLERLINSKLFTKDQISAFQQEHPLSVLFHGAEVELKQGIVTCKSALTPEAKKILERVASFAKNLNVIPSEGFVDTQTSLDVIHQLPQFKESAWESRAVGAVDLYLDMLALLQNVLSIFSAQIARTPVYRHSNSMSGLLWIIFGLKDIYDGMKDQKRAMQIGHAEGVSRAKAKIAYGASFAAGCFFYAGMHLGIVSSTHWVDQAAKVSGGLCASTFGVVSALNIGMALYSMNQCTRFQDELDAYLTSRDYDQKTRLIGAIRYLKSQVVATNEEKEKIGSAIAHERPELSQAEREELLKSRLNDLTEIKIKQMKRCSSRRAIEAVINHSDRILEELAHPDKKRGVKSANALIRAVKDESNKKMILYTVSLIAALIGLAGLIFGSIGTAGALPAFLYWVSSMIYLGIGGVGLVRKYVTKADAGPILICTG